MKTKVLTFAALFILGFSTVKAQLNVGGTTATDSASVLKVTSGGNKGFFPPKVALTDTLTAAPLTTPAVGLLVFNTNKVPVATGTNVTPGYYYYTGTKWARMITSAGADNDIRYITGGNHISADAGVGSNGTNAGIGGNNIGIGAGAINSVNNASATALVAIGTGTLAANTSGGSNTAVGQNAINRNTTGSNNVGVGISALGNTGGDGNVAVGFASVGGSGTYYGNVGIGYSALSNVTNGANVAVGQSALNNVTSGSNNTAIGYFSGSTLTTGSNNIAVGTNAGFASNINSNQLSIGNAIFGTGINGSVAAPTGNIGIGIATPNSDAALQISSTGANKGFMLPSVALTGTANAAPLSAHVAGMMVYNTATAGDVTPGLYINDGTKWGKITGAAAANSATSNGTAVVSTYTPGAITGTLTTGTAASGVTEAITANVTTAGTYAITTNTLNGIYFTGTATFSGTGSQAFNLTANGTPTAAGTFNYVSNTTPSFNFNATAAVAISPSSNGTAAVSGYTPGALSGTLTQGTVASGVTQSVTANVTTAGTYAITTGTVNGIYFTGTATFSGTGSQVFNLTANGTPTAVGTFNYVSNTTPSFNFNATATVADQLRAVIAAAGNATDLANYEAASINGVINVSPSTYDAVEAWTSAITLLSNDASIDGVTVGYAVGAANTTYAISSNAKMNAPINYFSAGQYLIAFQFKSFSGGSNDGGAIIKFASSNSGPYTDYTGALPSVAVTSANQQRYYVVKQSSTPLPTNPVMGLYQSPTWNTGSIGGMYLGTTSINYAAGNSNTLGSTKTVNYWLTLQAVVTGSKLW